MSSLTATPTRRQGAHTPVGAAVDRHPAPSHALHLTRRGRALVLVVLVALLYAAFAFGRSASEAAVSSAPQPALRQVTVQSGDTLWGVARRLSPDRDPRRVVEQLREINHLPSVQLQEGQQLLLPATG